MLASIRLVLLNMVLLLLAACASMPSDFEEPSLTISSIAFRNSNSIAPQFDVMMHITNPNRTALNMVGMSYTIRLAGNKVVTGVANDLPVVEPYGEADVMISAAVSLFGSIRLLNELMTRSPDEIDYAFDAKLDLGRTRPRININRLGVISLRQ